MVIGITINAIVDQQYVDQQYGEGTSFTETYFHCADCIQTLLMVTFLLISGLTLLFDPNPMARCLEKNQAKSGKDGCLLAGGAIFTVRIFGFILLAMIFLSSYEIATECQPVCFIFRLP